jgi:hypothetical protein
MILKVTLKKVKTLETEKFKLSDILYGFIIPLLLVLIIFVLAVYVNPNGTHSILGAEGSLGETIGIILTQGFTQMIILGVPLILGLAWNKWAGGAAGFIMGGMYYVASAAHNNAVMYTWEIFDMNMFGSINVLFYLVNAIIIGYMAGALNNGSSNIFRMIGASLTASLTVAVIQEYLNYNHSLAAWMTQDGWSKAPLNAFVQAFLPAILLGIIIPIIAKVMSWYGITAKKQY